MWGIRRDSSSTLLFFFCIYTVFVLISLSPSSFTQSIFFFLSPLFYLRFLSLCSFIFLLFYFLIYIDFSSPHLCWKEYVVFERTDWNVFVAFFTRWGPDTSSLEPYLLSSLKQKTEQKNEQVHTYLQPLFLSIWKKKICVDDNYCSISIIHSVTVL